MAAARSASQSSLQRPRQARRAVWFFFAAIICGGAILAYNDVSSDVTPEDAVYAERILRETGHENLVRQARPATFNAEVETILAVQDAVLTIAPANEGIPFDHTRELSDLYRARSGLCYDRSRAIEQVLSHLGFDIRHAAVYSLNGSSSRLKPWLTPNAPSHAVTEVKTARGWLLIDSNDRWIGLLPDGKPVDLSKLQKTNMSDQIWDPRLEGAVNPIFAAPFTYLYGLYSRHGRFYPPFSPVPDADWSQVFYNITD